MPRIAYYKGCVAGLSARELDASTKLLAPKLGLELVELESVTCCGAGDIQTADPDYALHLNARILAEAEHAGSDRLLTICNVCTLNLRQAAWQLQNDEQLRARVNENLERSGAHTYSGKVEVTHLLWLLARGEALERLAEIAVKKLDGLRVAPYYGCQLLRPSNLMGFEDPDRPTSLESVIRPAAASRSTIRPRRAAAAFRSCSRVSRRRWPSWRARSSRRSRPAPRRWSPPARSATCRLMPGRGAWSGGKDASSDCRSSTSRSWWRWPPVWSPRSFSSPAMLCRSGRFSPGWSVARDGTFRRAVIWLPVALGLIVVAALAWGVFEAGWVRLVTIEAQLPGLPKELDGLRIAHLSDFHLGFPSRGRRAVERAVDWVVERKPDLVLVSGDLLSRPSGEADLRRLLARLEHCYVVLGNHDFALSRDPFAKPSPVFDLEPATVLLDEACTVSVRGAGVQIVGVDPRSYDAKEAAPDRLADPGADLRICLCHFPGINERIAPGSFDLICAGHLHDGQIALPYPGGKLRFAHLRYRQGRGLLRRPGGLLHVSAGLGTTFVPFRFFARPEATVLVLRGSSEAPFTRAGPLPG